MTRRESFVAELTAIVGPQKLPAVQALIEARVDEAVLDTGYCCVIEDHWRESDTGDLFTGGGDDVGECDSCCPVDSLDRAGLVVVQVVQRCKAGHDWYGVNCPECHPED